MAAQADTSNADRSRDDPSRYYKLADWAAHNAGHDQATEQYYARSLDLFKIR